MISGAVILCSVLVSIYLSNHQCLVSSAMLVCHNFIRTLVGGLSQSLWRVVNAYWTVYRNLPQTVRSMGKVTVGNVLLTIEYIFGVKMLGTPIDRCKGLAERC